MKIRIPPVAVNKNTMEALGAIATPIAFAELYMALSTKTVDAQENPVSTIWASKFYEVQKYVALTRHIYTMMMFAANTNAWNRLTPEQRQIITEEGLKAAAEARKTAADEEDVLIGKLKEAGVTVTTPDLASFAAPSSRPMPNCARSSAKPTGSCGRDSSRKDASAAGSKLHLRVTIDRNTGEPAFLPIRATASSTISRPFPVARALSQLVREASAFPPGIMTVLAVFATLVALMLLAFRSPSQWR